MWFALQNYVWVHTRVQQAHEKHKDKLNIETDFDIKDKIVIFKAKVTIWNQVFNWSSFWFLWKDKAFEKLETVAVWRALAFAWFEIQSWIASKDEMDKWEDWKDWYNDFEKHKETMIEKIKNWVSNKEILDSIKQNYKVSKKTENLILNLN